MQKKTPAVLLSAAAALAVAVTTTTTGAFASNDAPTPQPKLLKAGLVTAPEINRGTSAVVFRTDHRLQRDRNGGSLRGGAGVGAASSSLITVHGPAGHPCYVAYVRNKLRLGHRYEVAIKIGDVEHHRTLKLHATKRAAERGADLGC